MTISERVAALQAVMKKHDIHGWIVPSSDPHESEYAAEHWTGRAWISGFTGSAGTVVIQQDKAALWTDGRYFIQAEQELEGSGITLMKDGELGVPSIKDWLINDLKPGQSVGFDGKVMPLSKTRLLGKALAHHALQIKSDWDLLETVWLDRPDKPTNPIFLHDDEIAGKTREEKMAEVLQAIQKQNADHALITSLDDIAWLFNLRGSDVECNPVFLAYALITPNTVQLFVDARRIEDPALSALKQSSIQVSAYEHIDQALNSLKQATLLIDPACTSQHLFDAIPESIKKVETTCPVKHLKAVKSPVEVTRMKDCHRRDGAAIVRFMHWLEENLSGGSVTEVSLDEKLNSIRAEAPEFTGPSFPTIAGYAEHGAVIHYRADERSNLTIKEKGLLLVDSGAQYPDGTTDITRTFACGEMTEEERRDYTLVLKCHINLARARFPKGTRGIQLDALARQPAWSLGQNYGHGTGHGVGYFLNVHEGPHSISPKWIDVPLKPGMLVTNEPGMYRPDKHGVRIENIMIVEEDTITEFGEFYKLTDLTLAPIDTRPLMRDMLDAHEIEWLNQYHAKVWKELSPILSEMDAKWLKKTTTFI